MVVQLLDLISVAFLAFLQKILSNILGQFEDEHIPPVLGKKQSSTFQTKLELVVWCEKQFTGQWQSFLFIVAIHMSQNKCGKDLLMFNCYVIHCQ